MKKILLLLCLSLSLSMSLLTHNSIIINAKEYPTVRELITSGELDLRELSMTEPLSLEDTLAASVSIYSNPEANTSSISHGHSWIVIKNYNQTRTYGTYSAGSGKSFSIGTQGKRGYDGIWYNVESSERTELTGSKTYYLKTAVMADKITSFRNSIPSYNYWNVGQNCAHFAVNIWNKAGGSKMSINTIETPASLISKIKEKSGYKTGINDSDFVNADKTIKHY
ncbi:MAG: hypothetical protein K2P09_00510 [Erysipelotrichales bacterium]|nr:hypothetical protein [Erysipelotrichales bacterium]